MKIEKKNIFMGIFFLVIFVLIIIRNIYFGVSQYSFYWYCNFVAPMFAFGFILNKKAFLQSLTYIGFFPQLFFLLSLPIVLIFNVTIIGISPVIKTYHWVFLVISLIIHISYVMMLIFTLDVKPSRKSLIISSVLLILIYLISYVFTPISENVNYIYFLNSVFNNNNLSLLWLPISFIGIVIPTYFLQKCIYNRRLKRANSSYHEH